MFPSNSVLGWGQELDDNRTWYLMDSGYLEDSRVSLKKGARNQAEETGAREKKRDR